MLTALACMLPPSAAAQNCLRVNNGMRIDGINLPFYSDDSEKRLASALYEGLVVSDPLTGHALPGMAESWTVSPDGLSITFRIREGAVWSNGKPVTSYDFVRGWLRALNPESNADAAFLIGMVVKGADAYNTGRGQASEVAVQADGDRMLKIELVSPMPYAIDMLSDPIFSPYPESPYESDGIPVVNGPFLFDGQDNNGTIYLKKNPAYWDASTVKLDEIRLLAFDEREDAKSSFLSNEIDWDADSNISLIDEDEMNSQFVHIAALNSSHYYVFNTQRKPLDDPRVRKALAMAIDKQKLTNMLGYGIPTDALVPPFCDYNPVQGNHFNPAAARKLLAEAGYPEGKGFPRLSIFYNISESNRRITMFLIDEWRSNLGIDFQLGKEEWAGFLKRRGVSHDFDIIREGWIGDYADPNTFLALFMTGDAGNDGLYSNSLYDKLLADTARLPLGSSRSNLQRQAEQLLVESDQVVIPLFYYGSCNLIDTSKWGGWFDNTPNIHPWKFICRK